MAKPPNLSNNTEQSPAVICISHHYSSGCQERKEYRDAWLSNKFSAIVWGKKNQHGNTLKRNLTSWEKFLFETDSPIAKNQYFLMAFVVSLPILSIPLMSK